MKKNILLTLSSLFAAMMVLAQSPAGVEASGSNQMWFDADQLNLNDGDLVGSWTDVSGQGNSTDVSPLTRRPVYNTSQVNGKPSLIFDGANDFFGTGAIAAMDNINAISHFIVFDGSAAPANGFLFVGSYVEHSQFFTAFRNGSDLGAWVIGPPSNAFRNTTAINPSYQITGNLWESTTGIFSSYQNGNLFGTQTGVTLNPTTNSGFYIGSNTLGGTARFNGGIAEVIVYSSSLNSAERNIITNYLGAKYDLAIANDFYAYETTHGEDVSGIGQESDGSNVEAVTRSTLQFSNMSTPGDGDYILIGHDGAGLTPANNIDVPAASSLRYGRVWRSDVTGTPGTVTITYDLSTVSLGFTNAYELLVDADGVFASGAVTYAGTYDGGSETVTFTNVTLADGDFITLSNTNVDILSTGVTSDWHTPTTWNCGCVPSLSGQVEIQAGHIVDINGENASVGNLTITGTLTFSGSDTLTLNQNFTNNGTLTAGTGAVAFESTSGIQLIDGASDFHDLIIDNDDGVSINSGVVSLQGFLNVITGSFTTNNSLTMLSNASGTGSFRNPSSGTIIGDVIAERFLDEGESYYLLGSPLTNATLSDWNADFEMQGFPGTDGPTQPFSSVYFYDETTNVTSFNEGYQVPSSTADVITNTEGYTAYVGDDMHASGARTIDLTGTPRLGDGIIISGTNTGTIGNPNEDGWNLVSNPYQSPVEFRNVAKGTNYDVAYRKQTNGNNVAINNVDIISPGEGFWMHCVGGPCSITFDAEDVHTSNDDDYNLKTANQSDKLSIKLNYATEQDVVDIGFSANADNNYNIGLDRYKLGNSYSWKPNLAILNQDGHDLSREVLHTDFVSSIPLRVYTEAPTGIAQNYSLEFENVATLLENNRHIVLEDKLLNTFTILNHDTIVSFTMNDTVTMPRFYLNMSKPLTSYQSDITCYNNNDGKIVVAGFGAVAHDYTWYDEFMNVVASHQNVLGADSITNLAAGKYKVVVDNNGQFGTVNQLFTIIEPSAIISEFELFDPVTLFNNSTFSTSSDTIEVLSGQMIGVDNLSSNAISYLWDFGDLTLSSLTNPSHIFFNPGIYNVTLTSTNGNCSEVSNQYVKVSSTVGLQENNLLNDFNVIAIGNEILVSLNNEFLKDMNISLYNSVGQEVYSKAINAGVKHQERITLDNASGIYLISVRDNIHTKTKKIVLNNK